MSQLALPTTFVSKKKRAITFRPMTMADEEQSRTFINTLSAEDTFIGFSGEQLTKDEEYQYMESSIKAMEKKDELHVVAEFEGQIIGKCDARRSKGLRKRSTHIAQLGLTISKKYRGEGIGGALMQQVITLIPKYIPNIRLVKLGVFAPNKAAIALYEKLGFQRYGRLPEGVLFHGEYIDHVLMYKRI